MSSFVEKSVCYLIYKIWKVYLSTKGKGEKKMSSPTQDSSSSLRIVDNLIGNLLLHLSFCKQEAMKLTKCQEETVRKILSSTDEELDDKKKKKNEMENSCSEEMQMWNKCAAANFDFVPNKCVTKQTSLQNCLLQENVKSLYDDNGWSKCESERLVLVDCADSEPARKK